MIRFLKLFLFFFCFSTLATAGKVRINAAGAPIVILSTLSGGAGGNLVVDSPSGDGTSDAAPARVYVPFGSNNGTTNNGDYTTYGAANLPLGATSPNFTGDLKLTFDVTDTAGGFLYAAVRGTSSTDHVIIGKTTTPTDGAYVVTVSLQQLCTPGGNYIDCTKLESGDAPAASVSKLVYFFHETGDRIINSTEDNALPTDGVFYDVKLSNKVSTGTIALSELRKGDASLTAVYQGFIYSDIYEVIAFDYGSAGGSENAAQTFAAAGPAVNSFVLDVVYTSGEIRIKELNNDQRYNIAIYFVDKYKFATLLSNSLIGTPQSIESLLKKNACFLLTAGFGGDHRIINYFRNWRDSFLLKTYLGEKFVKIYYSLGPQIAPIVLSSPWLAKLVRGGAYLMFWFLEFKLWLILLGLGSLGLTVRFYLSQRKELKHL